MSRSSLAPLLATSLLAAGVLLPDLAAAQTANGSPTDPAAPGLVRRSPPSISRTAPSTGPRRAAPGVDAAGLAAKPLPKPTAAELAEKRKLDHDLNICIGC